MVPDEDAVPAARIGGLRNSYRDNRVGESPQVGQADPVTHDETLEPAHGRDALFSAILEGTAVTGVVSRLTKGGAMAGLVAADVELREALGTGFRGRLIGSDDPDYDTARKLYNAMIDKQPRLIAQCVDAADVIAAVNVAREAGLDVAVRCGAHNGPGLGSVDDGLVIDLSRTARCHRRSGSAHRARAGRNPARRGRPRDARVRARRTVRDHRDDRRGRAHAGRGRRSHDSQAADSRSTISSRRTSSLPTAAFVTATRKASIRTSSGRCAAVAATSVSSRASRFDSARYRPSSPDPRSGRSTVPRRSSRGTESSSASAPEELNGFFAFLTVPPGPPFPRGAAHAEDVRRRVVLVGRPRGGETALWRRLASCSRCSTGSSRCRSRPSTRRSTPFIRTVSSGTGARTSCRRFPTRPWRSTFGSVRRCRRGSRRCTFIPSSGAAARVGADETAWTARDGGWVQVMVGVDPEPENRDLVRDWCVSYWEALHPYSAGGSYVNMMMEEGRGPGSARPMARTTTGSHRSKAEYDPGNLFHVNQNIQPA